MSSPVAKRSASSSPAYSPPAKKAKAAPKPKAAAAASKKASTSTNAVAGPSSSSSSSSALTGLLSLPLSVLTTLPQEKLVENVQTLQAAYLALQGELGKEQAKKAAGGGVALTPEQVKAKAGAQNDVMVRAIERQMKWQPSCKTGRTKWNYSGVVPSEAVFFESGSFQLGTAYGRLSARSLPLAESLRSLVRRERRLKVDPSLLLVVLSFCLLQIRYGSLQITSAEVTLKWNKEDLTFTVSGLYGL